MTSNRRGTSAVTACGPRPALPPWLPAGWWSYWGLARASLTKLAVLNSRLVKLSRCVMGLTGQAANFAGFGILATAVARVLRHDPLAAIGHPPGSYVSYPRVKNGSPCLAQKVADDVAATLDAQTVRVTSCCQLGGRASPAQVFLLALPFVDRRIGTARAGRDPG